MCNGEWINFPKRLLEFGWWNLLPFSKDKLGLKTYSYGYLRTWRWSDSSYVTLCRQSAPLFSNDNGPVIVLLNKTPFWSSTSLLYTVHYCLRLFCKPTEFVTNGTVLFLFPFSTFGHCHITWSNIFHSMER